jgi:signal transduction histidine kinase
MSIRKLNDAFGQKNQVVIVVNDVTFLVKQHGGLMQGRYQQAITATVSHEQMNPLNSIINFSELLLNQTSHLIEEIGTFNQEKLFENQQNPMIGISLNELTNQRNLLQIMMSSSTMLKLFNTALLSAS